MYLHEYPNAHGNGPESTENPHNNALLTEDANDSAGTDIPLIPTAAAPHQKQNGSKKGCFLGCLSVIDCATCGAASANNFSPFSGHSDLRDSLRPPLGGHSTTRVRIRIMASARDISTPLRWSTADDRALKEAFACAKTGGLFVGVNRVFSFVEVKSLDSSWYGSQYRGRTHFVYKEQRTHLSLSRSYFFKSSGFQSGRFRTCHVMRGGCFDASSPSPRKHAETHKQDLLTHPFATQFQSCDSPSAILTSL